MGLKNIPLVLSMLFALIVIPLTLGAVKVNQDRRSQAMSEPAPLPTLQPIQEIPVIQSPSATPSSKVKPKSAKPTNPPLPR